MVSWAGSDAPVAGSALPPLLADGTATTVPDAHLLFTADFSRVGGDLLLTGTDGTTQLIEGYYDLAARPVLRSPEGAVMIM